MSEHRIRELHPAFRPIVRQLLTNIDQQARIGKLDRTWRIYRAYIPGTRVTSCMKPFHCSYGIMADTHTAMSRSPHTTRVAVDLAQRVGYELQKGGSERDHQRLASIAAELGIIKAHAHPDGTFHVEDNEWAFCDPDHPQRKSVMEFREREWQLEPSDAGIRWEGWHIDRAHRLIPETAQAGR